MLKIIIYLAFVFNFFYVYSQGQPVYKTIKNDTVYYNFINNEVVPIEVYNASSALKHPSIRVKKNTTVKSKDTIFKFIAIPKKVLDTLINVVFSKYVQLKFDYGDKANSKHDTSFVYTLPFKKGEKFKMVQGFNGKKSHRSLASKYAIDFKMPIGTPIMAIRDGIVVYTIDYYKESGGPELRYKANKIVIMHTDGTFASYAHLMYQGVAVKKGDIVKQGQHIGYSGNTGYSGGPHIHIAVRDASDVGVPIYFKGYLGKPLKNGKFYKND